MSTNLAPRGARRSSRRPEAGFTLIEVLVVLLVLGIVAVGLYQMLVTSRTSYDRQKITLEMQTNARAALEGLAADFRHVSYGKDPTQPSIHYAGPDSVTFVADIIPEIPGAERISYALSAGGDPDTPNPDDTILMKTVADSADVVIFREPQSYGIANNGLNLRYFNGQAVELPNPVPHPELIGEIQIEVVAVEPRVRPRMGTYLSETLSATIYPRNLPLTPARSRPSKPAVGTLTLPDCTSATVPWNRPTTYTDGTPLPLSEISHFTLYVGTEPDQLEVNARLSRTSTSWTVSGLTGGDVYYFALTCTSTSDVESFYNLVTLDMTSPLTPDLPTGVACVPNPSGAGVVLSWSPVTTFTEGSAITTTVDYLVYRDTSPGVIPGSGTLLATVSYATTYTDETLVDCDSYYYVVTARACGNEGDASAELFASRPAAPNCLASLDGQPSETPGWVDLSWAAPTTRQDGTPLSPGDVSGYRIYYGSAPQTYEAHIDVPATPLLRQVTGLATCTTYYFNATCIDDCGHEGSLCPFNEVSITTSEGCDPDVPAAVASLSAQAFSDRVELSWPANFVDCDLQEYRLYYGQTSGGPYDGSGATEGPSPITLDRDLVRDGDSCRAVLSGLPLCQSFVVMVTARDGCDPPHESPPSPELSFQTHCDPCDIDAGCVQYVVAGSEYSDVRLEIYPIDGLAHTLTELRPAWSGAALIDQVWAGRPLVKVWDANGSAGGNGNIGPQPSGTLLDLANFQVPTSSRCQDGLPLMLCYDADQRFQTLALSFYEGGDVCDAETRSVGEAAVFDDFDDGNYTGWQVLSGTWSVSSGDLYQSSSSGVRTIVKNGPYTDTSFEAKFKNVYGQSPYLIFRYVDENNFHMLSIRTSDDDVRICRYRYGNFSVLAQASINLANNTWYLARVDVAGTAMRAYLNCEEVLEVSDANIRPSGKVGLRTYNSRTYFDDVRLVTLYDGLP